MQNERNNVVFEFGPREAQKFRERMPGDAGRARFCHFLEKNGGVRGTRLRISRTGSQGKVPIARPFSDDTS
jgi:hypothetical protein